uniref:FAR1 domain-containing protein n=1 Tax=Davidia involucrata TaxID=16924 RepID=A0A5B7B7J1_DAVIN
METPIEDKFVSTESLTGVGSGLHEVDTNQEPYEGMLFESDGAAKAFYDEYARQVGFLTRIVSSRKSEHDGSIISRRLACNKEGYNLNSQKTGRVRIRKRESKREGCMAMILVKREKPGRWVVRKFVKDHNHPLVVSLAKRRSTFDERDKKIQELTAELRVKKRLSAAYREQLRTLMKDVEDHNEHLSTKVQVVLNNLKELEAKRGAFAP